MGEVYLAQHLRLKHVVALKRLAGRLREHPDYRARFLTEGKRASKLTHECIARVFDFFEEQNEPFLVMEYIEGASLRHRLLSPLDVEEALQVVIQAAEALAAAHEKGIVHGDIKPENIMLTPTGGVKVLDFGVARHMPRSDPSAETSDGATTEPGVVDAPHGTMAYMAPELLRNEQGDGRSDIFSLGVVLYEVLAGRHPFLQPDRKATEDRILHKDVPPVHCGRTIDAELNRILRRMLAKPADERYATSRDLVVELRGLLRRHRDGIVSRWKPVLGYAAVFTVAACSAIGVYWYAEPRSAPAPVKRLLVGLGMALAERDWVVVGEFVNQTGDQRLGQTLKDALIYELEQSPYINLVPENQVREVLTRMKRPTSTPIDESVGREVCQREGLKALLLASIGKLDDQYSVRARVIHARSGRTLATSPVVTAVNEAGALEATRRVGRTLRGQLGETLHSIESTSVSLEPVTSASFEAVQQATLGRRLLEEGKPREALSLLLDALERDPEFAMAHQFAALAYASLKNQPDSMKHMQAAADLASDLSPRERFKIVGDYNKQLERYAEAIANYASLLAVYPDDSRTHANLGVCYADLGKHDLALKELEEADRLNPSTIGRRRLAQEYFAAGHRDMALRLQKEIVAADPNTAGWTQLALYYTARGDIVQATNAFTKAERVAAHGPERWDLILARADAHLAEGHFSQGLRELELEPLEDPQAAPDPRIALISLRRAEIWLETGQTQKAAAELHHIPDLPTYYRLWLQKGVLSARAEDFATADAMLHLLEGDSGVRHSPASEARLYQVRAEIAMARGLAADALRFADEAVRVFSTTYALETLARAQRRAGQIVQAANTYQALVQTGGDRAFEPTVEDGFPVFRKVLNLYELAHLLEQSGQVEAARERYAEILRRWNDADPDVPAVREARRRTAQGARSPSGGRAPTPAA
jgi:tetratricopeptide (TPR) repeat protein